MYDEIKNGKKLESKIRTFIPNFVLSTNETAKIFVDTFDPDESIITRLLRSFVSDGKSVTDRHKLALLGDVHRRLKTKGRNDSVYIENLPFLTRENILRNKEYYRVRVGDILLKPAFINDLEHFALYFFDMDPENVFDEMRIIDASSLPYDKLLLYETPVGETGVVGTVKVLQEDIQKRFKEGKFEVHACIITLKGKTMNHKIAYDPSTQKMFDPMKGKAETIKVKSVDVDKLDIFMSLSTNEPSALSSPRARPTEIVADAPGAPLPRPQGRMGGVSKHPHILLACSPSKDVSAKDNQYEMMKKISDEAYDVVGTMSSRPLLRSTQKIRENFDDTRRSLLFEEAAPGYIKIFRKPTPDELLRTPIDIGDGAYMYVMFRVPNENIFLFHMIMYDDGNPIKSKHREILNATHFRNKLAVVCAGVMIKLGKDVFVDTSSGTIRPLPFQLHMCKTVLENSQDNRHEDQWKIHTPDEIGRVPPCFYVHHPDSPHTLKL